MTGAEFLVAATGAAAALKSVSEALAKLRGLIPRGEPGEVLADAQQLVISAQSQVLSFQATVLALQQENADLKSKLHELEARKLELERYERRKVGKATVVVPKGEEEPHYCLQCFEGGELKLLSRIPGRSFRVTHVCMACKSTFDLSA